MNKGIKIAGRVLEILHVEDSVGDATLFKQVLKKSGFPNKLNSVLDGEQALSYLKMEKNYSAAVRPDVIILDLKLPGKDGLTVLNEIRQNTVLTNIPVIILTGSESDLDMSWASRLNVNHYMVKPYELNGFEELVKLLKAMWVKTFRKRFS